MTDAFKRDALVASRGGRDAALQSGSRARLLHARANVRNTRGNRLRGVKRLRGVSGGAGRAGDLISMRADVSRRRRRRRLDRARASARVHGRQQLQRERIATSFVLPRTVCAFVGTIPTIAVGIRYLRRSCTRARRNAKKKRERILFFCFFPFCSSLCANCA